MIENLETLLELRKQGTMTKVSAVLRISQSAVSKRIATIEHYYGTKLVEKSGRNVSLTSEALNLVEKLGPLLVELREALREKREPDKKKVILGVSESILSSWGAAKLERIFRHLKIDVDYHSHRSPLVLQKVEAGTYDLGFCSGKIHNPRSLISESLTSEELVLVADSPRRFQANAKDILSIEKTSATWKSIQNDIRRRNLTPIREIESFFSIGQLSKAGYGVGLIPIGVAEALGIKKSCIQHLKPKLFRPVQIVFKKSKLERPYFRELLEELRTKI